MNSSESQIQVLTTLLQLERTARLAQTENELAFVLVNETLRLIPYRQAVFLTLEGASRVRVKAISGLDRPDANAPFCLYLKKMAASVSKSPESHKLKPITGRDLDPGDRPGWSEWGLGQALWCPLLSPEGRLEGGLLLARDKAWQEGEIGLLERLMDAYAHAWTALRGSSRSWLKGLGRSLKKRWIRLSVVAAVIAVMFVPVRLTVLAPVEIVAENPTVVSAPMDGVVKTISVLPNQIISAGDLLFTLDDTATRNEYEVAEKALAVARAEYMKATQKGFTDDKSRAEILLLQARIDQKTAEVRYADEVLQRSRVRADHGGVVVFSDVHKWLGKPVVTGEKVMTIADPKSVESEIMLPVEDAINLRPGAEVQVFLNTAPDRPLPATLRRASYEAEVTPLGALAFRLKATLKPSRKLPRIGLRGTAKIYGEEVTLFYYLFRRPIIWIRLSLGI
jgi:hypothetical protein